MTNALGTVPAIAFQEYNDSPGLWLMNAFQIAGGGSITAIRLYQPLNSTATRWGVTSVPAHIWHSGNSNGVTVEIPLTDTAGFTSVTLDPPIEVADGDTIGVEWLSPSTGYYVSKPDSLPFSANGIMIPRGGFTENASRPSGNMGFDPRSPETATFENSYGLDIEIGSIAPDQPAPTAAFTTSATYLSVDFKDKSDNGPTSWFWDFGDGQTSREQNPTHVYSNAQTYLIRFVATNGSGESTIQRSLQVVAEPVPVVSSYVRHRDRMVQESVFEDLQNTLIACRWISGTTSRPVIDPNNPTAGWTTVTTTQDQILRLVGDRDDGSLAELVLVDYFPDKINSPEDVEDRPLRTEYNTFAVDAGVTGDAAPMELGSNMLEQPYLFSMAFYATSEAVAKAVMNDLRDRYQGRIIGTDFIDLYNFNDPAFAGTTPPVARMEVDSFRYTQSTIESTGWGTTLYVAELQVTDFIDPGSA